MPCPECAKNHERTEKAQSAEKSLLLFLNTVSKLSEQLVDIEREVIRQRRAANPPPAGAELFDRKRYLLVPADSIINVGFPLGNDDKAGERP